VAKKLSRAASAYQFSSWRSQTIRPVSHTDWLLNNKTAAANTDIHLALADRTAAGKDLQERSSRDQVSADRGIDKQQTCFEALC
jgi:hypothetical protein